MKSKNCNIRRDIKNEKEKANPKVFFFSLFFGTQKKWLCRSCLLTTLGAARDACKGRTRSHTDAGKTTGLCGLLKGLNLKVESEPGSALACLEASVGYSSPAVLAPALCSAPSLAQPCRQGAASPPSKLDAQVPLWD